MTKYSDSFIDEHRDINVHHEWWDSVYEHFSQICGIIGIDVDHDEPSFSGFWSQGDGASFTGRYYPMRYDHDLHKMVCTYETAPAAIREHAPQDEELHKIVDELCTLQRIYAPLYLRIGRNTHNYVHSNTMADEDSEVFDADGNSYGMYEDDNPLAEDVAAVLLAGIMDQMRLLADWLYSTLDNEYDHLTSDEEVIETLLANDMEEETDEDEDELAA